jgi:cell division protein FtsA
MNNSSQILFLEINNTNFIFSIGKSDELDNFKINYKLDVPLKGFENNRISDLEKAFNTIKESIYLIEQKLNFTFKEIVIILENFNLTFINLTGFKKLNGSQVLRENITYILNTLKSYVGQIEPKKSIVHIFNSKFYLDNKKIENLPIGLFGDFYSHELSFALINKNDHKNLNNIFDRCNLNIKKLLIKSFIKGANISEGHNNIGTFFQIKINKDSTRIFYFENNSLKFEQSFKFGVDIILNDISKVTSLKKEIIKMILEKLELKEGILDNELIEEEFFKNNSYRKIKKKLIYEIALARINEISELVMLKNINLNYYNKVSKVIFLEIDSGSRLKGLKEVFKTTFSMNGIYEVKFLDDLPNENLLKTANKLVYFGWKKEAIPIIQSQKSIIARFFEAIFS